MGNYNTVVLYNDEGRTFSDRTDVNIKNLDKIFGCGTNIHLVVKSNSNFKETIFAKENGLFSVEGKTYIIEQDKEGKKPGSKESIKRDQNFRNDKEDDKPKVSKPPQTLKPEYFIEFNEITPTILLKQGGEG